MKQIIIGMLLLLTSAVYAESNIDYSGIWEDNDGLLYSINQSADSIVLAELRHEAIEMRPFEQGGAEFTANELDLMLYSLDFFVLELSDGSFAYTRAGKFSLSADGRIVNESGYRLVTEKRKIIPGYFVEGWQERVESNAKAKTKAIEECGESWQCVAVVKNKAEIFVSMDGVISLADSEIGDLVEFDRILLASIYPKHLKPFGDDFVSIDPGAVDYFYPADKLWNHPLMQGALEYRSAYKMQVWLGYTGTLVNHTAVLKPSTETKPESRYWHKQKNIGWLGASTEILNDSRYGKEISFNGSSNAVLEIKCRDEFLSLCDEEKFNDKLLTKVL